MNGPIRRVIYAIFVGLALLLLSTSYIQAVASARYRTDPANSRVLIAQRGSERRTPRHQRGDVGHPTLVHP